MDRNAAFFEALDTLVHNSRIVIDRPRGSAHPRYPSFVYPVDYGYLAGTSSMDGAGIDVFLGQDPARHLDSVVCTVDLMKHDSEIKLLIGCTEAETEAVLNTLGESPYMKCVLIRRGKIN